MNSLKYNLFTRVIFWTFFSLDLVWFKFKFFRICFKFLNIFQGNNNCIVIRYTDAQKNFLIYLHKSREVHYLSIPNTSYRCASMLWLSASRFSINPINQDRVTTAKNSAVGYAKRVNGNEWSILRSIPNNSAFTITSHRL